MIEEKWKRPGNIAPMKGVRCFYKAGEYRAEVYERQGKGPWSWNVFKNEELINTGSDYTLPEVKRQCRRTIEVSRGDYL